MADTVAQNPRIVVRSPAKVNWTLRVLRKRPDGFHEIESLVSTVTLYDDLEICGTQEAGLAVNCNVPGVPDDERNLVWRAAELLGRDAQWPSGIRCRLTKRIPIGGGLGGGSSNAAATLVALNEYWSLGRSKEELSRLAADLGSDVPLFLDGGSAVISGRGERVVPTRLTWRGWMVLLMPGLSIATPDVYRAWRPGQPQSRPIEPSATRSAVEFMNQTFNMLEAPAITVCPQLGGFQRQASELAGRPVRVSGSGSTLFTAFDQREEAAAFAQRAAEELGIRTEVVQPVEQA